MRYLLDTNVISELWKGEKAARSVVAWLRGKAERELFLSVLTLAELKYGIELISQGAKRSALEQRFAELQQPFLRRTVAVDAEITRRWAQIRASSVEGLDVPVINPFEPISRD